jgi:hypothetical protein
MSQVEQLAAYWMNGDYREIAAFFHACPPTTAAKVAVEVYREIERASEQINVSAVEFAEWLQNDM